MSLLDKLFKTPISEINVIKGNFLEVSSKEIRQKIKRGLSLNDMIPKLVKDYIKIKGLYNEQ